jgi:hypothetical protein
MKEKPVSRHEDDVELPPVVVDRRGVLRRRVFLRGKIAYGIHSLNCCIRDISAGGARLSLLKGQMAPNHFDLIEVRAKLGHAADIVGIHRSRDDSPELHVRFASSYSLREDSPDRPTGELPPRQGDKSA